MKWMVSFEFKVNPTGEFGFEGETLNEFRCEERTTYSVTTCSVIGSTTGTSITG